MYIHINATKKQIERAWQYRQLRKNSLMTLQQALYKENYVEKFDKAVRKHRKDLNASLLFLDSYFSGKIIKTDLSPEILKIVVLLPVRTVQDWRLVVVSKDGSKLKKYNTSLLTIYVKLKNLKEELYGS